MPLPWQRPVKDFASRSMFSSFGKNEKLHFLKTTQPIYLLKSNGLCCMKKNQEGINFQYHKWKMIKKKMQSMFLWQRRGAISIIFLEA